MSYFKLNGFPYEGVVKNMKNDVYLITNILEDAGWAVKHRDDGADMIITVSPASAKTVGKIAGYSYWEIVKSHAPISADE